MRVHLYARLSRSSEESTSVERQISDGRELAERRWPGVMILEWADDGVSGALDPFRRTGFGALAADWDRGDVVVIWKIDRLARSVAGFSDVVRRASDDGVSLVAVRDPLDLTTAQGEAMAHMIATFAQFERAQVQARVAATRRHLLASGKWTGGRAPYGLRSAPHPSGQGRILERDYAAAKIISRCVDGLLSGRSMTALARELESSGVPSPREHTARKANPKAAAWSWKSVKDIVLAPHVVGHAIDPTTKRTLRGDDGLPVIAYPPIVSEAVQDEVRAVIASLGTGERVASAGRHWLFGVTKCGECGGNMETTNAGKPGAKVNAFRCYGPRGARHRHVSVRHDHVSEYVADYVRQALAGVRVQEREWVGGRDTAADLERLREYRGELEDDQRAGLYSTPEGRERFRARMRSVEDEIATLSALPPVESGWVVKEGKEFYTDCWDRWTPEQRGDDLRTMGATVTISPPAVKRARVPLAERVAVHLGELDDAAEFAGYTPEDFDPNL